MLQMICSRFLLLLAVLLTFSCGDDDKIPDGPPDCSDCGIIEKYYTENSSTLILEPINNSVFEYQQEYGTRRGMDFTVEKKIRITAIGGIFRKKGNFAMELFEKNAQTPIYSTTINVNDTENFVFHSAGSMLIELIPGPVYRLRYCDENHDSVFDMRLKMAQSGTTFAQPFDFGDITLIEPCYSYINACADDFNYMGSFKTSTLLLRGIVDFKYEVVE